MWRLDGKTALVTGASRGIGRAIAEGLAQAGANVALLARDRTTLDEAASRIAEHTKSFPLVCDVTDAGQVRSAVDEVVSCFGRLDIVVNNAGGCPFLAPFAETRPQGWDRVMRLNLDSTVAVCRSAAGHLLEHGGSVVNVASAVAFAGAPRAAHYAAAKSAVLSLTRSLAIEWAPHGVRVNALCPGYVSTDLSRAVRADESAASRILGEVPMARWGEPAEMVGPAVFLASPASSFMTGQVLVVDGGLSA
ncbi:SDR family NAD(P)-dependent oxidoreductase [Amycolatopsis thermoflava]